MSDRQLILEAVQEMPETASFHEIVEELALMAEVKRRLEKNPQGKGVPAEELLAQVSTWVSR
jgi:predicted transcriptional regulator